MTSTRVHYRADYAARGGPVFDGPTVAEANDAWLEMGALALVVLPNDPRARPKYGLVTPSGEVVAEADNPSDLTGYIEVYAKSLYEEITGGWEESVKPQLPIGEMLPCYQCKPATDQDSEGWPCVLRKCVKLGYVAQQRFDPTQTYVLECGHVTI